MAWNEVLGPLCSDRSIGPLLQLSIEHGFLQFFSLDSMSPPSFHAPYVRSSSMTSSVCPLRVPLYGQAGDVRDRFPQSMANPSPFPSSYCNFNSLLPGVLLQLLVGDLPWPPKPKDIPEPALDEGLELGDNLLCRSPGLKSIEQNRHHVGIEDLYLRAGVMNFDPHIGIKMEKAVCALKHLTTTSSSVSPVVVIRPPSYVKAATRSRIWPAQLMLPAFARDRILVSLVLVTFTSNSTLAACSCRVPRTSEAWRRSSSSENHVQDRIILTIFLGILYCCKIYQSTSRSAGSKVFSKFTLGQYFILSSAPR